MKDSLKWLLAKFPYFLDKNAGSNFYKSSTVINNAFKDFRQDLFNAHLGQRLQKRVLIWKEQEAPGVYEMNFYVHLPYLKMVNVYKNDSLIYSESYEYSDEVDTFVYSLDETSETVIPSDKYYVTVETWEEFVLAKGFPENDTVLDDIYDHDSSLDEFGALYDIPRKTYTYTENTNPANTEPHYNNRLTEDDYHYMNRILGYISHMQDTPLPVLEVWKLFGISLEKISLINRERYLCKMYSSVKHGGDDWTPKPWEHKDPMGCYWPEPVFFFVEVDNHSPVLGQSIYFRYTFMNMYGEDKGKDYLVDVYLDDDKIAEDVDPSSVWEFDTTGCDDEYPLTFKFIANPLDTRAEVLESDEIIITIKGCNSADWYVAVDGSDDNDGSRENPFLTLPKALSMVEGSRNVIVLKSGTFDITGLQIIDTSTSIISCQGATIRNDVNYDFFRILQECNLYLMGITLKHKCCEMYGCDDSFYNFNYTQNPVHLRINKELMCKPPVTVQVDSMTDRVYAHSNMEVEGTLLNSETEEPVPDEIIELISEEVVLDTDTTDENGEYGFSHELTTLGYHTFTLNHVESSHYCMGSTMITVSVEAMPTTLTAMMDSTVLFGDELTIAYDLTDYYGNNITDGSIVLYEDGAIVATVDAGEELDYTPTTVGTHTYKLVYDCDSTYVSSESEVFTVVVRRYETNLLLECDKSTCMPSDTVNVTGLLTDELGNRLSGQTVKLYDENTLIYTGTTNNQGIVTYSHTFTAGVHTLQWKYEQTTKYEAVNSNSYRLRVRDDVSNPINLFLYPTTRIGVSGTSVALNVYACDEHGDPISTSFKLVDTYNGSCGVYPSTTYTTGNDGWWTGTLSTNAIVNCHGTYIQAVSTVDTDYYSNTVHVFDEAETPLTVTGDLTSSVSTFDKDTSSIPVSVSLVDESNQPLPNESFSIQLVSDGTVAATTTGTTEVTGEKDLNVSVPSSVKGKDLTVRLVYNGRANAYGSASDSISLTYIFSPEITLTSTRKAYPLGDNAVINGVITDEFGTVLSNKQLKLYNGTTLLDTDTSDSTGEVSLSSSSLLTGATTFKVTYTGSGVYHDAESTITVNACEFVAEVNGNSITIGDNTNIPLVTTADVFIDWGDGTSETLNNRKSVTHTYTDGESSHEIVFCGTITSVGDNAFREITGLTGITIPDSVTTLGTTCFYGCSGLTSVIIPDSVTSIGTSCFYGCSGLTSVTISDSITSLGYSCFADCSGLTSVIIPDSVTSIGTSCFYGCTSLTDITIPDNVTSLGASCFSHCSGLTSVTISDSVTTLGNNCFYNCSNLMEYKLYWTSSPVAYSSSKMPTGADTVFSIPAGTTAAYTSASYPSAKLVERGATITLTADKPIITSTETSTITAQLISDGRALTSETLTYQIKHGSTVIDSGSDVTDSNGEIDISYTGTAVGQVDVVVSYGMLLQETYEVWDTIKYDNATSDSHNDSFWVSVTNITRNESDSSITSSSGNIFCHSNISGDVVIELDLKTTMSSATNVLYFTNNSGNTIKSYTVSNLGMSTDTWKHLKITIVDSKVTVDGTSISEEDITGYTRLSPRTSANNTTYFKNLKVYSA